jgi:hypothetical protein
VLISMLILGTLGLALWQLDVGRCGEKVPTQNINQDQGPRVASDSSGARPSTWTTWLVVRRSGCRQVGQGNARTCSQEGTLREWV